jgi:phage terminase small subunit
MNTSAAPDSAAFAVDLADAVCEREPLVFSVREGTHEARADKAPDHEPPAVFERVAEDPYRTKSGRERGELLRLSRDADGHVVEMYCATYPFTRLPQAFGR